jgi:hypothetical protein
MQDALPEEVPEAPSEAEVRGHISTEANSETVNNTQQQK